MVKWGLFLIVLILVVVVVVHLVIIVLKIRGKSYWIGTGINLNDLISNMFILFFY